MVGLPVKRSVMTYVLLVVIISLNFHVFVLQSQENTIFKAELLPKQDTVTRVLANQTEQTYLNDASSQMNNTITNQTYGQTSPDHPNTQTADLRSVLQVMQNQQNTTYKEGRNATVSNKTFSAFTSQKQPDVLRTQTEPVLAIINSNSTFNEIARYDLNCSNVDEVTIIKGIGSGVDKRAFLAEFRGKQVVVKTAKGFDGECIALFEKHLEDPLLVLADAVHYGCKSESMRQLIMELVYHTVFRSLPQFVTFHGFCLHKVPSSIANVGGRYSTDRPMIVTELGTPIAEEELVALPRKQKLNICKEMAPLLDQMQDTVLGPISMFDFKTKHFVMINNTMKMFDLGLFFHGQLPCGPQNNGSLKYWQDDSVISKPDQCLYDAPCVQGKCVDVHKMRNNFSFKRYLLYPLLGREFYKSIPLTDNIMTSSALISRIDNEIDTGTV